MLKKKKVKVKKKKSKKKLSFIDLVLEKKVP